MSKYKGYERSVHFCLNVFTFFIPQTSADLKPLIFADSNCISNNLRKSARVYPQNLRDKINNSMRMCRTKEITKRQK